MPASAQSRAIRLAERQHGLVTRRQFVELGCADRTLRRRVEDGVWIPVGRGVFRLRGTDDNLATRSRAVALQVPDCVLTGPSAAAIRGPEGPWASVGLGALPFVVGRWHRGVAARFVTHPGITHANVGGIQIADRVSTTIDLVRFLPLASARTVAYRAAQTGLVSSQDLAVACERLVRHSGAPQLRVIAADVAAGVQSEAERTVIGLLKRAGLGGWTTQHPVDLPDGTTALLDLAFSEARLAIEIDGRSFHVDPAQFELDRRRQNSLVRAGWTVLRFTWADISDRPRSVIAQIQDAAQRAS